MKEFLWSDRRYRCNEGGWFRKCLSWRVGLAVAGLRAGGPCAPRDVAPPCGVARGCERWGSPPGWLFRPMRQHAIVVSLRLPIRRAVPSLDRWSPSSEMSSSLVSPLRRKNCPGSKRRDTRFRQRRILNVPWLQWLWQRRPSYPCAVWYCLKSHSLCGIRAWLVSKFHGNCPWSSLPGILWHNHLCRHEQLYQNKHRFSFP